MKFYPEKKTIGNAKISATNVPFEKQISMTLP